MYFRSTRNSGLKVSGAQAVLQGISADGGLFVPEEIPHISMDELKKLSGLSYSQQASDIISRYFTDFTSEEVAACTEKAYNSGKFDTDDVYEISHLFEGTYLLELWHGPTCAFKYMALQILPHFLATSAKKLNFDKEIVILVATSGDTGKAALEGFCDVDGTKIIVFYPEDGVSAMQKLQMTTQSGKNVTVCAVKGNFDDCQNGVKKIFGDSDMLSFTDKHGASFSSANSINFGRLLPQIVYYISSYVRLAEDARISFGDKVNIVVPTGNFGNILAAYYAKRMGLPVAKLICASNSNNVLTDFINTGTYDRNREFFTTCSPSMDILISSNLERLIYELSGCNDETVRDLFGQLASSGKYTVSEDILSVLRNEFSAGFCDDNRTKEVIKKVFDKYSYVADTHTAVALGVYEDYREKTGDLTPAIVASTASPYKFAGSVIEAISGKAPTESDESLPELLSRLTNTDIPTPLASLKGKTPRFKDTIEADAMCGYVRGIID